MNRPLVVNPDYFTFNVEQLYEMLCKKILEKKIIKSEYEKVPYEIYSADHAGIQFIRVETDQEWHILKEEMLAVLTHIKNTHEFKMRDIKTLVERKQSPTIAFLVASDIIY